MKPTRLLTRITAFLLFSKAPILVSGEHCPHQVPDGGCSVCGEDMCVGNPAEFVAELGLPCGFLESAGLNGQIPQLDCAGLPSMILTTCGCSDEGYVENCPQDGADIPILIASIGEEQVYCDLNQSDRNLFELLVTASLEVDPTGAFLQTCLQDFLQGFQVSDYFFTSNVVPPRQDCEDGKTEIAMFTVIATSTRDNTDNLYEVGEDGIIKIRSGWDVPMCKSSSCDEDVLQQVLQKVAIDYFQQRGDGSELRAQGWYADSTVIPTAECVFDQIGASVINPELYCQAGTPACSNMKIAEITIADDAPFDIAICADDDCLASVGPVDVVGNFANADPHFSVSEDPFCVRDIASNAYTRSQYVSAEITDKVFDKTQYCTAAAYRSRTARCGQLRKATKSPKVPKVSKVSKAPKV